MAALTENQASFTREQLRTFHIAGTGLEHAIPVGAFRPAAIELAGEFPPFTCADLPSLYEASLNAARGEARAQFLSELKRTGARLKELLDLDDRRAPQASSPATLEKSLGAQGGAFFDSAALAAALRAPARGFEPMPPARRSRIEATLATLYNALRETAEQPAYFMFEGPDAFDLALNFCDGQLRDFTLVLRALALARLEIESAYDPAVHDEALNRFDWQAAGAEELLALPPALVIEAAERLAQSSLTAFSRVLRSGRPIQVIVISSGLYADDLSGSIPDFGYLSIAHREAFVLQSSLARPDHLSAGFAEMSAALRPAVAVVAAPASAPEDSRAAVSLACLSRAFPMYRYDPDRGDSWAERFQLLVEEERPLTPAHCAALIPSLRHHFRMLPDNAPDQELMELPEYLKLYTGKPPLAIPFLWAVDAEGNRRRAAVTRELVNLCRDRARAWRIFEELAGVRNAYVEAAVQQASEKAVGPDSGLQEKARLDGANQAIQRVVSMLLHTGAAPAVAPAQSAAGAAAPSSPPASDAPATASPEAGDAPEDPYIDSYLCTSCNDCFKVNPRLFHYDGNKQAFIADARAGTFAELVKAAEGCPAKCIHPGTPRPDDSTVTPQLLAKAARLR